jgi:hypothetical protein
MALDSTGLVRLVEVEYDTPASGTVLIRTDLPGGAMAQRATGALPATSGRQVARIPVPGTVEGSLWKFAITATGIFRIYGVRVFARTIGRAQTDWGWHALEVAPTPDTWTELRLPIEPTPEEYSALRLPIEPTPEEYSALRLPIEPTPEEYSALRLPIEPTPEEWTPLELPIEKTPDILAWAEIPVDQ